MGLGSALGLMARAHRKARHGRRRHRGTGEDLFRVRLWVRVRVRVRVRVGVRVGVRVRVRVKVS